MSSLKVDYQPGEIVKMLKELNEHESDSGEINSLELIRLHLINGINNYLLNSQVGWRVYK